MNNKCKCIICGKENIDSNFDGKEYRFKCPQCGTYYAEMDIEDALEIEENFYQLAPSIACEKKLMKQDGYHLVFDWKTKKIFADGKHFIADFPKTYPERLNRVLLNLARAANFSPMDLHFTYDNYFIFFVNRIGFEQGTSDADKIVKALKEEGYLEGEIDSNRASLALTLKGIKKALELQIKNPRPEDVVLP